MAITLFYFLQVCICSLVLFGYYLLFLRNKKFHHYNRFYLVGILILSWIVPLIRIPLQVNTNYVEDGIVPLKIFEVVADNNTYVEEVVTATSTPVNWNDLVLYGYILISLVLFLFLVRSLTRIYFLLRSNSCRNLGEALLVITQAKGTPFSFFRFIFWNNEIDLNSNVGKQILQHELAHVKEKHSIDKIINSVVLSIGWFNPVFWLVKRELDMVHEFIADKKAVNDDPAELAQMLLTASYPVTNFSIANSFFHSPIKRRLAMMSNFNISRQPYLRRLLILPLIAVVVMLFAFRKEMTMAMNTSASQPNDTIASTEKLISKDGSVINVSAAPINFLKAPVLRFDRVYTVMIDAGHGGHDRGAAAIDGTTEADITLEIIRIIKEENKNRNLNLVFTREEDVYQHPQVKSDLTIENKADLFVSIHAAAQVKGNNARGIELFIPTKDTMRHYQSSYSLANVLANTLNTVHTNVAIKKREVGIWVLNSINRPAVLIETGYLTNENDLVKLKSKEYKVKLARAILKGIEMYLTEPRC
jgi:N-acetylmuramoyl-L-alanine amidase